MPRPQSEVSAPPELREAGFHVNTKSCDGADWFLSDAFIRNYGPSYWRQLEAAARPKIPPVRLQHLARHLHQLGARCVYEALRELIAGRDPAGSLEAYGEMDVDIVHALGADRFPPFRVLS
jgi:hypothetical protein